MVSTWSSCPDNSYTVDAQSCSMSCSGAGVVLCEPTRLYNVLTQVGYHQELKSYVLIWIYTPSTLPVQPGGICPR